MWGTWKEQGGSQGRFSLATNALNHLVCFCFFFLMHFFPGEKGVAVGGVTRTVVTAVYCIFL